ncbi:PREDICTED: alpha-1-acid glycoprotein 2 [Hipposideros armiger]|uniref:Alpha-1-acid glycoprotein 2 n=1 Tax=Hipposideros armiger TaxID=186990 RepID=A0A8B7QJK7_HIPAR|nr:PREDICTED: alpha-1-acid glycoprotein 2 [Hipposideros armiger]
MALPWALGILSLLPLLNAQSAPCHINYSVPITNATLDQLSRKWFYIASAYRHPEYNQSARTFQTAFFYFDPDYTEDRLPLREYSTINDKCIYNSSYLDIQRENGTMSKHEMGKEHFGHLVFTKDPSIFMLAAFPEDKQNMGLSFYADKPQATQEQMRQFYENIMCMGMDKSEITYTDEKKDQCGPLEKQHDEERKKEKDL